MDLIIFIIGFVVTMSVIYGIFSQVPLEIRPDEENIKNAAGENGR